MARERQDNFVLGVVPLFAVPPFSYENQCHLGKCNRSEND